jgi:hypothetical protein
MVGMALMPGRRYRRRRLFVRGFSLLLVGGTAYKIGQAQADQIQQYTGRPPEDLSKEELENAMEALNIEPQELNDEDKAAIEAEVINPDETPSASTPAQKTAPQSAAPAAQPERDYISEIERLADLRDRGILTEDEFEAKKKKLMGL